MLHVYMNALETGMLTVELHERYMMLRWKGDVIKRRIVTMQWAMTVVNVHLVSNTY